MNEKGSFWLESMLTLSVVVVIFGTLLPLATKVTSKLYERKLAMHAAETAYYGSILYRSYQLTEGTREIDGKYFDWVIEGQAICVVYEQSGEETAKCINY